MRKCKKNTQEQYEILKFDPAKTLINQGFSAEKTARANAHFESFSLRLLRYISVFISEYNNSTKKGGGQVKIAAKRPSYKESIDTYMLT